MTADALGSPEVTSLRQAVPEFEATFQEEFDAEDGELGAFQATSAFAEWVRNRLDDPSGDDAIRRAFAAVERLIIDSHFPLGDALAAEFIEGTWDHPRAEAHMGAATRGRTQNRMT